MTYCGVEPCYAAFPPVSFSLVFTKLLHAEGGILFWWGVLALAVAAFVALFHWILTGPDADQDLAKEHFRLQQDARALRRAGKLSSR
jgi:hypothetical protein